MMSADEEKHYPKLFTLEEANALLPTIARKMMDIQKFRLKMLSIAHSKDDLADGNGNVMGSPKAVKDDIDEVGVSIDRIRELVDEINVTGAEVKDIERGLVDFPHERAGRIVFLCWTVGEQRIAFWHETDAGYAGRQPL